MSPMAATKGLIDHLLLAACEWFLMFWVFIDAALAYSLTKFARYCDLQIPCLLCSRLDHFFDKDEPGSYFHLFCNNHQADISYLIYCNLHNELVDLREICEDCLHSQSNLECYRFVVDKNIGCMGSSIRTCSCCKRQWKEKPSGQPMIDPHMSRGCNLTTKPPLPRMGVARSRVRPRHGDGVRRVRNNRTRNRRNYAMSLGSNSDANLTSDSEFEFLFSDDDDGLLRDHHHHHNYSMIMRGTTNDTSYDRSSIFGNHSYSTPDLGSLLIGAQLNQNLRARSASVTPQVVRSLRRTTEENNPYKIKKYLNPSSSSSMEGLMGSNSIGSQNPGRISSRHSYSACDLGSALLLEMQLNSLPRRSASVTPNTSSHGFGEFKWPKCQPQPQPQPPSSQDTTVQNYFQKKRNKSSSSTNSMRRSGSYGHLDDSFISRNTGTQNQNKIPRRHSYSVFQLGCEILLNMPTDEPLTSNSSSFQQNGSSFGYGFQDPNSRPPSHSHSYSHLQDLDALNAMLFPTQRPNGYYGSLDDSFVPRNTGNQYQNHNSLPRRHSYSFFEVGCEILLNMPNEETLASRPTPITQNPNQNPNKKTKKGKKSKKSKKSKNQSPYLHKSEGPSSWDDSVISHSTEIQNGNRNLRRHYSYSAFELGNALIFEVQKDETLTRRSSSVTPKPQVVLGLGEQNKTKFNSKPNNSRKRNHGKGTVDDSYVTRNNNSRANDMLPRRHSYSVFQLGGDILLNMPHDENFTAQSSYLPPNDSYGEPQQSIFHIKQSPCHSPEHKSHNQHPFHHNQHPLHHNLHPSHHNGVPLHPPASSVKKFSSSSDHAGHNFSGVVLDRNKWHGSMDDSAVLRSMSTQNQSHVPRRHSVSGFDLGRAILAEIQLDESLKRSYPPHAVNSSSGHGLGEFQQTNLQNRPNFTSSERKMMPWPKSDHGSRDDSFLSHKNGNRNPNRNQSENQRRHSFSALELGCALLLEMQREESVKRRRSASVTPNSMGYYFEEQRNPQIQTRHGTLPPAPGSSNTSLYNYNNNRHHGLLDDSFDPHGNGNRKRNRNLTRNSYSVSDLTSPSFQMEESYGSKSATLTPSCSIGQGLGELDWLKFQTGSNSGPQDSGYRDSNQLSHKKRKKANRGKGRRGKKQFQSLTDDDVDEYFYDSYDDTANFSNDTGARNRYAMYSRNSQSVNDLGSVLLEMHLDDSIRSSRSKSLTPNSSIGYGPHEERLSKTAKPSPAHSPERHFHTEKHRQETERDKKHLPPLIPNRDNDMNYSSSNINRTDTCSMCSERMDARSLDGSVYTEMEVDGIVEIVKKKAEDDVRCLRLLQSELEAERNAATVAANHAMNMITRLQQEKASLQMEALQYLRMMEEQAEYDMEALQKANELVEEKENEIQDLLDELEQYRIKYGDISMGSIHVPVIIFENEKRYILESLSTLERKLNQLTDGDHMNDENSFLTPKDSAVSNGVFEKCQESDLGTVEHELLDLKEKIEGLQADIELVKHACNSLHASEGLDFIQEITHQLQDLRRIMVDKRGISSN